MSKLLFLGDSITAGAWDTEGGWASRLIVKVMAKTIAAGFAPGKFYCMPYNLGISGNTVADILRRLKPEIMPRLDTDNTNESVQIVYAIGVNDSVHWLTENRPRFTNQEFRANLEDLARLSKEITSNVSFLGLLPVNDEMLQEIPWAPGKSYANRHVQRFEQIIGDVCHAHELPFFPLFNKWENMPDYKRYLIDGIHPNPDGHALLASQIGEFLLTEDFIKFHTT